MALSGSGGELARPPATGLGGGRASGSRADWQTQTPPARLCRRAALQSYLSRVQSGRQPLLSCLRGVSLEHVLRESSDAADWTERTRAVTKRSGLAAPVGPAAGRAQLGPVMTEANVWRVR